MNATCFKYNPRMKQLLNDDRMKDHRVLGTLMFLAFSILVSNVWKRRKVQKNEARGKDSLLPPFAPGNMKLHVQKLTSTEFPFWLVSVVQKLGHQIFQVRLPFGRKLYFVGSSAVAREILLDPKSTKPDEIYKPIRAVNGGNPTMFTLDGKEWHPPRKSCAPAFSSNHVKRMTQVALEKTEEWIQEYLLKYIANNESFDIAHEIVCVVLIAIMETAFEYSMTREQVETLSNEIELALMEFALKTGSNPLHKPFGLLIPERQRAYKAVAYIRQIAFEVMDNYRKLKQPTKGTIIQRIMDSDDAFPNDDLKAAQLIEFIIAGSDTTSYSIAFILLELAKHPKEQQELRKSLLELPSEKNFGDSEMLHLVIKEVMRLNPVSSGGSIRKIGRDVVYERHGQKMEIPKDSVVWIPFLLFFRDEAIFDSPTKFAPKRWINPTRDMLDALIPFSLGKQNCIGQSLAKAEMQSIVSRIISEFELILEDEGSVSYFLTLKPVGARLKARKLSEN